MTWTKKKIVEAAFTELRLSGYVFDMTPEELVTATDRLEAVMASVEQDGVQVGYVFGDDIGGESGVPMHAVETVFCLLACRLATNLGKEVRAETMRVAAEGMQRLRRHAFIPAAQQLAPMFGGAGVGHGRPRIGSAFLRPNNPPQPIQTEEGGGLTFTGAP